LVIPAGDPRDSDGLITGHQMPGMTGIYLVARNRMSRPDVSVILASGFTRKMTRETMNGQTITVFLSKPLKHRRIGQYLGRRRE